MRVRRPGAILRAASPGPAFGGATRVVGVLVGLILVAACDKDTAHAEAAEAAAAVPSAATAEPAPAPSPSVEPPRAPEIIVDQSTVSIGKDHLPTAEANLDDRLTTRFKAEPTLVGHPVEFVAMRNAKPSQVASIANALRRASATGAEVKTEARDGATLKLDLSFATKVPDCAAIAWIAKDGAIDVWPAGGATAQRMNKGLAGPDMTLGTEALARLSGACTSPAMVVGADDHFPWGLVFDLATSATQAHAAHATSVILTTNAVPGRKLKLLE